ISGQFTIARVVFDAFAQVEDVRLCAILDLPAFSQLRDNLGSEWWMIRVATDVVVERFARRVVGLGGGADRVQLGRIARQTHAEDLDPARFTLRGADGGRRGSRRA